MSHLSGDTLKSLYSAALGRLRYCAAASEIGG
nr:MAG TPA: hypothetical protein [Caudoviricetes sp.]